MSYIADAKKEISKWENQKPGYLSQVSDFIFWPAQKAAEALIPQAVQDTVTTTMEGILNALRAGSDYTFSDDAVLERVRSTPVFDSE